MRRKIVAIIILSIPIFSFIGCGVTHHFLPPTPLEKKEWRVVVYCHYDFSNNLVKALLPEVSAYYGLDGKTNLGFGYQCPIFCSHLSIARYWASGNRNWWAVYSFFNQPFGLNNNPYLELGGSYSSIQDKLWQTYRLGLAYGHSQRMFGGLWTLADSKDGFGIISHNRLMPTIGYQIGGRNLGFSYVHYHGGAKAAMAEVERKLALANDTLFFFQKNQVDSIIKLPREGVYRFSDGLWCIYLAHGEQIIIHGIFYSDCMAVQMSFLMVDYECEQLWNSYGYSTLYAGLKQSKSEVSFIGNIDSIIEHWRKTGILVITKYPEDLKERLKRKSPWLNDHSVAVGYFDHEKPRK